MWAGPQPSYAIGIDVGGKDESVATEIMRDPYGTYMVISVRKLLKEGATEVVMPLQKNFRDSLPAKRIIELGLITGAIFK